MKLYDNPASPFCRKVQVLARETSQMNEIELIPAAGSPVASEKMPTAENPLGKIPTLVLQDGHPLYDSRVICRYLDEEAGNRYYTRDHLYDILRMEALCDGIMDAAVLMVYEFRAREEGERSERMVEAQWEKVTRALDYLETQDLSGDFDMGQIALACALGYLDFRHAAREWRQGRPKLAAWFEHISQRPSLVETVPSA